MPVLERAFHKGGQPLRYYRPLLPLHVHYLYKSHRRPLAPLPHGEQFELAGVGVIESLHRRRCRAEHHRYAERTAEGERGVAGVVLHPVLLLVRGLVLLVYYYQPEIVYRRKERGAGADHYLRLTLYNPLPLV